MNTRRKIELDRRLFAFPALLLNAAARVLGRLLRRDHSLTDGNVRVIVIAKLVGMGSIIQSTVLLRSLRERYPAARILYFTLAGNAELCRRLPGVDGVLTVDDSTLARAAATALGALAALWKEPVDLYFDLEVYSHVASILCTLSLARNRFGFFRQSCTFKQGMHTHLLYLNVFRHLSEALSQMARMAGAEPAPGLLAPQLTEQDHAEAQAFLEALEIPPGARLAALNANASDLLLERRWPAERFVGLIEELVRTGPPDLAMLLIGSPAERAYLEGGILAALSPAARERVFISAGRLSLFGSIALLGRCAALVTNDTGPMHFAWMLGVPTVSLWGPGLPAHYGPPQGVPSRVVYKGIYCSPCLYHTEPPPCRGDNQCMKRIGVGEVLTALGELLGFPTPQPPLPILEEEAPLLLTPLGVVRRP